MTDTFKCERCGTADTIHATQTSSSGYLCHRCKTGSWHGQFPEEKWEWSIHGPALNVQDHGDSDTGYPSFS